MLASTYAPARFIGTVQTSEVFIAKGHTCNGHSV